MSDNGHTQTIYVTEDFLELLEQAHAYLKSVGIVPQDSHLRDSRTLTIRWCVQTALDTVTVKKVGPNG